MAKLEDELRRRVHAVRDSYCAGKAERKELYLFLKKRPDYKSENMRRKLGNHLMDWALGLEKYGDKHGWMKEEIEIQKKRLEAAKNGNRDS